MVPAGAVSAFLDGKIMKFAFIASLYVALVPTAYGAVYYLPLQKDNAGTAANIVLKNGVCDMAQLTGPGWQRYLLQLTGPTGVVTTGSGCWMRKDEAVYVLPEVAKFWLAPDFTGGNEYYRLDRLPCSFKVPGISFTGWRTGRSIAILKLPKSAFGNVGVLDQGPLCWQYHDRWFEMIEQPMVYSAAQLKSFPSP
ncbi:MAG: hypothetical protein ACREU2_16110 [Steroidobacteraceae bacterium]